MSRKVVFILLLIFTGVGIQLHAERLDSLFNKYKGRVRERLIYAQDSVLKDGWVKQLVKNRFDVNDSTLEAPKFVDFCLKVYRWGDETFNSYDSTYVASFPKKWKLMLKANTKWDMYDFDADNEDPSLFINSDPRTSVGFRLSFMAVGFEYMPDVEKLFAGKPITHRRTRFSFYCSRIIAEMYINKNSGQSHINKFGNYNDGHFINEKFDGLSSSTFGIDVFYVFNHKKYAHSAPYGFSKLQRRSAGSFILGLQFSNQKLALDASKLPENLKPYNPWGGIDFHFHNYDYALNIGYGYSWVFHPNWVFNITLSPSIGIKHCVEDTFDGPNNTFATNLRARLALVRNCGNFFYGLHGSFNGYTTWSKSYVLYNQISDVTAIAGLRF